MVPINREYNQSDTNTEYNGHLSHFNELHIHYSKLKYICSNIKRIEEYSKYII